jgi:DNA polymerase-3 subunit delta'
VATVSGWDDLVGQDRVVEVLSRAAAAAEQILVGEPGVGMTHAWLFTGPPGSGRSTAARSFAAALQCPRGGDGGRGGGCGDCAACRTVRAGTHADVEVVSTRLLSIGVNEARELVHRTARHPSGGRWQVVIMEDADRMTEQAANTLLKAVEEPAPRTVWLLCAPSLEDVIPTIRSRCRLMALRTPPTAAVAEVLIRRDGVDPAMAAFAARASQGHIGRARRLATDEQARLRRKAALDVPLHLAHIGDCITAASNLVEAAQEEATRDTGELDAREAEKLGRALGAGTTGRRPPSGASAALKELEKQQKRRATRTSRDAIDRALTDLASFYRDVLALQVGSEVELTNAELRPGLDRVAGSSSPEQTLRRLRAVLDCREDVAASVAPLLAAERLTLRLRAG